MLLPEKGRLLIDLNIMTNLALQILKKPSPN